MSSDLVGCGGEEHEVGGCDCDGGGGGGGGGGCVGAGGNGVQVDDGPIKRMNILSVIYIGVLPPEEEELLYDGDDKEPAKVDDRPLIP